MSEYLRGSITNEVLTQTCRKMPSGFTNLAGITARTQNIIYHIRTEPTRDRIFHAQQLPILKDEKTSLIYMLVATTFY